MKEFTKAGLTASTNPILLPFELGDRDQEGWSANKIPSGNPGILFRSTKSSLGVSDHESLIETKKLALFTNFHKSYSFPGITPEREVFSERQQACINSFVTQSVHQCALYSADLLYQRMENSVEIDHSEKNTLCRPAALQNMGNFSGALSHNVTTIPITQVTDVPEAASSSLVGHSTSSCSLLLSDDNDHLLIFSRPEKVDDHSANSNNNNYKNAIPAGIVGGHDGANFEKFDSQDSSTSSAGLPSVESQSKPVLWKNEESLNVTVQLDKLTDYPKRDEVNEPKANGETEVTNVSRDGNRGPKGQQCHYKGIQAVPEDSSQRKIQLVLDEMSSSLDYEPSSNGDESDDSDAYIRRRLIEINAKFAQEPLPSDKGQVRETKVAFKKQLIDLVAPSPDLSRTEPADVRLEWSGAWEKVADSCDSVLSEDFSQPIVHESSPHLENVQVNIPAVKILNAVRPIQSVNAEELTAIKQEANMGDSAKRAAISRPITTVSPRNYFVGSTILNPVRNNTSKKPSVVQSSELRLRPKSAWQTSLGNEKSHGAENPRIIAVKTWIEEKNRIQRAKRRDELEQQIKEEEDRKRKQVLDQELREKHWFAWLKAKSKKVREERELKRRQEAEKTYFAVAHTKKECDRAFREWLRRKAVEQQQRLQDVRHRLKITRQVMQTCRTTQKWTRVIDQAKIYKLI